MTTSLTTGSEVLLSAPRADSFTAFGRRVEIWVAHIDTRPGTDSLSSRELISRADAEQAARIGAPGGRMRFTAGRALARWALAAHLDCRPAEVPLATGRGGRPELAAQGRQLRMHEQNPEGIDFNLSHSGDQVAVAVAHGVRVGIDIERVIDRGNAAGLADRVFSEAERGLLARTPPPGYLVRWYQIWTMREAYVKARGTGLSSIAAELPDPGTAWLAHEVGAAAPGYAATAVACREDGRTEGCGEVREEGLDRALPRAGAGTH